MRKLFLLVALCVILMGSSFALADEGESVIYNQKFKLVDPRQEKEIG